MIFLKLAVMFSTENTVGLFKNGSFCVFFRRHLAKIGVNGDRTLIMECAIFHRGVG
jgi:hypothetical protein